jgi:phosphoglucosamine mutase
MGRLFGTDGVRGLAGTELTEDLAWRLGRAAVVVLGQHGAGRPVIVVGRDPRESGEWLEDALVAGICEAGGDAVLVGVEPTPAIAFLTVDLGASSGVVISASHNPPEYNGIKFFASNGMKLPDELEDEIESMLETGFDRPAEQGHARPLEEGKERYLAHLVGAADASLEGMTVVVDCANGAASALAPELLRRLGATVYAIHADPDGKNINQECGALYPEIVAAEVVRLGADAGVSHDGDADRALFSDASGVIVDGDQVLAACALDLGEAGLLARNTVVTTVMANLGFHHAMREAGIEVVSSKVGDRYVLEDMIRVGAILGGEQSGHLIFREHATTGDGLLTAARFLSLGAKRGAGIQQLASVMRRYPQVLVNIHVRDRDALAGAGAVWAAVRDAEATLGDQGRVLVRASGTEPLVRVMIEAESEELAMTHAAAVADAVRASIGIEGN